MVKSKQTAELLIVGKQKAAFKKSELVKISFGPIVYFWHSVFVYYGVPK